MRKFKVGDYVKGSRLSEIPLEFRIKKIKICGQFENCSFFLRGPCPGNINNVCFGYSKFELKLIGSSDVNCKKIILKV